MKFNNILAGFFIVFLSFFFLANSVANATVYDLVAPSGQLTKGQDIQFTINIDTEGASLTTASVGMNFETTYLSYVGTTAGDAMTSVSVEDQGGGRMLLTGSNQAGFSGKGLFAYVTFKIIAQSAGETTLCALWAPSAVPTSPPTGPTATSAPKPTNPPGVSPTPPTTGSVAGTSTGILMGSVLLAGTVGLYLYRNSLFYEKKPVKKITHGRPSTSKKEV